MSRLIPAIKDPQKSPVTPKRQSFFPRFRRFCRIPAWITLISMLNMGAEGLLWAQTFEQAAAEHEAMRSSYLQAAESAGLMRDAAASTDSNPELAASLMHLEATLTDPRIRNEQAASYVPLWAAIQETFEAAESIRQRLGATGARLSDGTLQERHRAATARFVERFEAIDDLLESLEEHLETQAFSKAQATASELSALLAAQGSASKTAPERPHLVHHAASSAPVLTVDDDSLTQLTQQTAASSVHAQAADPTETDLAPTPETEMTSAMYSLISSLDMSPARAFHYVRNRIQFLPTSRLTQSAGRTLTSLRGSATDQAALLIGLLRGSGIPARYVHGKVRIPGANLASWLGTDDVNFAVELLSRNGVATRLIPGGGGVGSVEIDHTWIRVWVNYGPRRGLDRQGHQGHQGQEGIAAGDRWIDLDPSFKGLAVRSSRDVTTEIGVDPETFLGQIEARATADQAAGWVAGVDEDFIAERIDAWGDAAERYAAANDLTTKTLFGSESIVQKDWKILPLGLPYEVVTETSSGASPRAEELSSARFTLQDAAGTVLLTQSERLDQLAAGRLILDFVPASPADQAVLEDYRDQETFPAYLIELTPRLLLDDEVLAQGSPIGMGERLRLEGLLTGPTQDGERFFHQIIAGSYTALVFDLSGLGMRSIDEHLGDLRRAKQDLAQGEYPAWDPALGPVLGPVLGRTLQSMGLSYWYELDRLTELAAGGLGVRALRRASELAASYSLSVTEVLGAPFEATAGPVTISTGLGALAVLSTTGDADAEDQLYIVSALTSSVLEHALLEQTLGGDAVSTVRLLQAANEAGGRTYRFELGDLAEIPTALASHPTAVVQEIENAVNSGLEVTVSGAPATYGSVTGSPWIAFDPATGSSGFFLGTEPAGGLRPIEPDPESESTLRPSELLEPGRPAAYLPLVEPGIRWVELMAPVIEETGFRYIPAVASIGRWFAETAELSDVTWLASGIAISAPISLLAGRPKIGHVLVYPEVFSPNDDGVKDELRIVAGLSREADWRADVIDAAQVVVASFTGRGQKIEATWDARTPGGAYAPEGDYTVRLAATSIELGTPALPIEEVVAIDVTAPTAEILTPTEGESLAGLVSILGTVDDAHFASYRLQVGSTEAPTSFQAVAAGQEPILQSTLGLWNGLTKVNEAYTFRLLATDLGGNSTEVLRSVTLDDPENDLVAPEVTLLSPSEGEALSGPMTIRAQASDDHVVERVVLAIGGGGEGRVNLGGYPPRLL